MANIFLLLLVYYWNTGNNTILINNVFVCLQEKNLDYSFHDSENFSNKSDHIEI